jgi:predicted enzyme related to lactoylglutathione lyase
MSFFAHDSLYLEMRPRPANQVVHLELHSTEGRCASSFYEQLFGWERRRIDTPSGAYESVELGARLGGGIVDCPAERSMWLPYVQVEDVRSATDRAGELGARVLLSPREGPVGWRSVIGTREGAEIALWQPKR